MQCGIIPPPSDCTPTDQKRILLSVKKLCYQTSCCLWRVCLCVWVWERVRRCWSQITQGRWSDLRSNKYKPIFPIKNLNFPLIFPKWPGLGAQSLPLFYLQLSVSELDNVFLFWLIICDGGRCCQRGQRLLTCSFCPNLFAFNWSSYNIFVNVYFSGNIIHLWVIYAPCFMDIL